MRPVIKFDEAYNNRLHRRILLSARIDLEILAKYSEGLICTSACPADQSQHL